MFVLQLLTDVQLSVFELNMMSPAFMDSAVFEDVLQKQQFVQHKINTSNPEVKKKHRVNKVLSFLFCSEKKHKTSLKCSFMMERNNKQTNKQTNNRTSDYK